MSTNRESLKYAIANRYGPEIANKIRHLESLRKKRVRLETSLTFLIKCRDNNLLPSCVRLKPRKDITHSEEILRNASVKLLRKLIKNNRFKLSLVHSELYTLHCECSAVLSRDDFDLCDKLTHLQAARTFELCTSSHNKKYEKTQNSSICVQSRKKVDNVQSGETGTLTDTVINLSTENINGTVLSILEKGLNFALTPTRIPYENIISNVEEAIIRNKLPPSDAEVLRQDIAVLLRKSKVPKSNATTEERCALKSLRNNKDILILRADKGNATVVINTVDYNDKIGTLLDDTTVYKAVSYNPTARVTRRIRALIKDHQDLFTEDEYCWLYKPKIIQPPKLYGLPKVHKNNVPLRPIVSQINSPTYDLARYVASVLQPLVGKTPSYVKDSRHFLNTIRSIQLEQNEIMVSFDVQSLFTNVPINECLTVIREKLRKNSLSEEYIILLEHCLEGNYFLYQGQYYLQIDGVAMGSPVAPVIANIWMEHFEEKALATGPDLIRLWLRYVDDIFCIIRGTRQEADIYLHHLNSIHPKMVFTYEMETDRSLPFLDIKLMVRPNGSLAHTVYRKPTHTDRYLHASSHHHPRHLGSVVTSLINRAHDLCDINHIDDELLHIHKVLKRNGFSARKQKQHQKGTRPPDVCRQPAFMPYVKGVTDKIGTLLKDYCIKTVFTPFSKVAKHVRTPKDVIPYQSPGVYRIDCSCGSSYIGQTKRTIAERVKEHITAVKNRQINKSAIAEHIVDTETNHWIELHEPKILSTDRHYYPRIVREAIEIKKHKNFNREEGYKLSSAWNPVIDKFKNRGLLSVKQCQDIVSVVCRNNSTVNHQVGVVADTPTFST